MTWLLIDTHTASRVRAAWLQVDAKPKELVFEGRAALLLPKLARTWSTHAKELAGIVVVAGPGSFTSVRTGVLQANLLARFLKVPLYSASIEETEDLHDLTARLQAGELMASGYVAPIYDAEPNITMPKP